MLDPVGIANWSVTHVDWSEGKWHPKSYKAQDVSYGLMRNITVRTMSKHLFHLPFVYSYYPCFVSQFSLLSFSNKITLFLGCENVVECVIPFAMLMLFVYSLLEQCSLSVYE